MKPNKIKLYISANKINVKIDRSSVPSRLAMKFYNDYSVVMKHYTVEEQLELSKYLRQVFKLYYENKESTEDAIQWIDEETDRLKIKYGKKYAPFVFGGLFTFLLFDIVLVEKEIYTTEEFHLIKEQGLTISEKAAFLQQTLLIVNQSIDALYLQSEPQDDKTIKEKESDKIETDIEPKRKGKIKREREDNVTKLNQEQTALLIHFLQAGKIILRDEYLNNKEAGQAFSILTGFSADSIRQNLSDNELKRISNKKNLDLLYNSLTSLQLLIDKERKENK